MFPKWHIFWGFIFGLILINCYNFSDFAGLIVFLSTVFIDIDHCVFYVWLKKDWGLFNAFSWFEKSRDMRRIIKQYKSPVLVLHSLEVLILFFVLGIFYEICFWIFLGFAFHWILDFIETVWRHGDFSGKISLIAVIITNKKKRSLVDL